jgi:hypothetical protein
MPELKLKEEMEKKLDKLLSPVTPNSTYVNDLQKRLTSKAEISVEYPNYLLVLIVIGSGLAFGLGLVLILNMIGRIFGGKKE